MEQYDSGWRPWPVVWSAVILGALSALAVGLVIGLIGFAVGAHEVSKAATWKNVRLITLIFNISGAFFAFVVGGWVAARIAGFRRAESGRAPRGDRVVGHASDPDAARGHGYARQLWRVAGIAGRLSRHADRGFLGDRYGGGHAQYCAVESDRRAGWPDGQRDRWMDGLRRADDAEVLPASRPGPARGDAHPAHRLATCGLRSRGPWRRSRESR